MVEAWLEFRGKRYNSYLKVKTRAGCEEIVANLRKHRIPCQWIEWQTGEDGKSYLPGQARYEVFTQIGRYDNVL